jgi:protein SCO1/2
MRHRTTCAAALLTTLAAAACSSSGPAAVVNDAGITGPYRGIELPTHARLPHAQLTDTNGRPYDPAAHDDHPVTLLFTGYTNCPDVCPTVVADIAAALRTKPDLRSKVQLLFVSTDPRRDTTARIRSWLDKFDPTFIGLRGPIAQVAKLSTALGMPVPEDDGTTHSSEVLAFVQGKGAQVAWLGEVSPADLEHDLPLLVKQT